MKVVCWNLGYAQWFDDPRHEKAWRYLIDELDPDLALLQQAHPPAWAREARTCVHVEPLGRWGSVVVTEGLPADLVAPADGSVLARFGSSIACARVALPNGRPALVASVETKAAPVGGEDLAGLDPTTIKRSGQEFAWYNDLAYAALRELAGAGPFIVGGDWQTGRLLDRKERHRGAGGEFFARAERDGWVECVRRFHPEERRTLFRGDLPYQLDHVFCDPGLGERLRSCDVFPQPAAGLELSDRAPIAMELDL